MFYNLLISPPNISWLFNLSLREIKRYRFALVRWQSGGEVLCFGWEAASRVFVSVLLMPGEPQAADIAENVAQNKWIRLAVAANASHPVSRAG